MTMPRSTFDSLRAAVEAESISYGELLQIDEVFEQIDPALLPEPPENAMASDRLDEIERLGLVVDDVTVRYLLIELPFRADIDPDDGPLGSIAEQAGEFLDGDVRLVDLAGVRQVYPGDVVAPDAVPDIFDLDVSATLTGGIGSNLNKALDALQDEREGDFKKALADILDAATRLARFAGAM